MSAAKHYSYYDGTIPNHELLEVNRSKISIHRAKPGYNYPVIRLPFTFSGLVGLSTRIYQTLHDGALAFLVVVNKGNAVLAEDEVRVVRRAVQRVAVICP